MLKAKLFLFALFYAFVCVGSLDERVKQVLTYWYGDEFFMDDRSTMETKEYSGAKSKIWWGGASCDKEVSGFRELVFREVATGTHHFFRSALPTFLLASLPRKSRRRLNQVHGGPAFKFAYIGIDCR